MPKPRPANIERFPEYLWLSRNMIARREVLGLSQRELAQRTEGLDQSYISHVESMKLNPTLEALSKVARALDTTIADLVDEPGEELSDDELARLREEGTE